MLNSPCRGAEPPIAAHRLLSDGSGAALVAHDGTVDWWCAPRFDSTPLLWSLLDADGAASLWEGAWFVAAQSRPAGPVIESIVRIDGRRVVLLDGLVPVDDGTCLVRLARLACDGPPLLVRHRWALGGFDDPWLDPADGVLADGALEHAGRWLAATMELHGDGWAGVVVPVDAVVPWARPADAAGVLLERADEAEQHIGRARLPRHHPGRAGDALAVMRACTDRHTGAIVAAPTTSLPEAVGHDRQFDYRYCWIRDAALATSVAVALGQPAAAGRYVSFVADVVLPNPDEAAPVVGTHGDPLPNEREVSGVCGWGGSVPVRVGNAAADQVQYDAWGFVLEALLVQLQAGGSLNRDTWRLVRTVADRMAENEPGPESGIWELRDEKRLLSADIGRWLVLDRAVRIARTRRPWHRRSHWARARDEARRTVLDAMHDDGRLPQAHDDSRPDASALMAVLFGLVAPDDQRAHHLVDAVLRDLAEGAHVRRYPPGDDGFSGVEGTFLPLSWWVVSCLAILGRLEEAEARTDELCAGLPQLLPEMVDPLSGAALGNTPLVWSHVELARALVCLDTAHRMRWIGPLGVVVLRFLRSLPRRLRPQQ